MKQVLIVIPTYNEAHNIKPLIAAIETVSRRQAVYTVDLLFVDDTSPDGTAEVIQRHQRKHKNIYLLSGPKEGLGKAYIRGLIYGLALKSYFAIVTMDADLSHDPRDILRLIAELERGADYVIGSRYVSGGAVSGDWPLIRVINSRTANFVARKLVGISDNVTDLTGGFKAIRRQALEKIDLSSLNVRGYIFQVSLLHAFMREGFIVREVPITFSNRSQGTSKLKLNDIIEFLYRAYKLNPNAPVQRIVRFGFVGACGSVVNLAVLSFLVKVGRIDALIAVAIAIEVSVLFNFFLNHFYTFRGYGSYSVQSRRESLGALLRKMGIYNVGALGGAVISFITFTILYKLAGVNYLVSDTIGIGLATSWNYFVSTRFVWRAIDEIP